MRYFVERKDTLSKMSDYFSTTNDACPKIMILYALGGQGKSQIALKYCKMSREDHQGIFWINASSEATTKEAFAKIARGLDRTTPVELENSDQKVQYVLNTLGDWTTDWILVFDNYDSPSTFKQLRNYFPSSISICLNSYSHPR